MDENAIERLLEKALKADDLPDASLNLLIKSRIKEQQSMTKYHRPVARAALIVALALVLMTATAVAAWSLLSPGEVADRLNGSALSAAFQGPDALHINETVQSGGYNITLMGIVSGKGLEGAQGRVDADKTYAVVAIESEAGPMPGTADEAYGVQDFFVSPLVKGLKPWQVNVATMHGGYGAIVEDGITYRLVECDSVEMFADRGLYLCVSGTTFYDVDAYTYNEKSGEIKPNEAYEGVNALFTLPLDPALSDREKADAYVENLWTAEEAPENDSTPDVNSEEQAVYLIVEEMLP